jgi:hypothetical protein
MAYRPAHGAKVIGESERPNEQDRARCCTSTTSQDSTTALTLAYRQSLSSQGRQAHASAANTAITRVLYIAHRGAAHTASRPSCSDLSGPQFPFYFQYRVVVDARERTSASPRVPVGGQRHQHQHVPSDVRGAGPNRPVLRRYALFMPRPRRKWLEWQASKTSKVELQWSHSGRTS